MHLQMGIDEMGCGGDFVLLSCKNPFFLMRLMSLTSIIRIMLLMSFMNLLSLIYILIPARSKHGMQATSMDSYHELQMCACMFEQDVRQI